MFPLGFHAIDVETSHGVIHGVSGGEGPPLLLLHGIPETHLMWREVAGALADRFTVVATDLRGFGGSAAPPPEVVDYSMSSLATDQFEVMSALGYERFSVAGHDRGARCAYRMAIGRPERIDRLAVLDIVPSGDAFERADARFALGYWVWTFLAAPEPVPETLVLGSPDAFVDYMLTDWPAAGYRFPTEVRAEYVRQFTDPARVRAICAQYRAAATDDAAHDLRDRDRDLDRDLGRRPIHCPTLVLWSGGGPVDQWYNPLEVWRTWATEVRGEAVESGHFIAEELPSLVIDRFAGFFWQGR